MLDIKLFRENPEIIIADLTKRGDDEKLKWVEDLINKDKEWGSLKFDIQEMRHSRNSITKEINDLRKAGKDFKDKVLEAKELPDKIKAAEEKMDELREKIDHYLMRIPNILHESVPVGDDEEGNVQTETFNEKPKLDFEPMSHVDLVDKQDWADIERAGKISGARFFFLKGELFQLEFAIRSYALDLLMEKGFTPIEPPFMMRRKPYEGVTDLGDFEDVMYKIEDEDLYLIATSEHPLTAMFQDEVLEESQLPIKYAGLSTNFRKEVGSHGKDTKGIFRVHQFNKIEQLIISKPEDSWKHHEELINNAKELFKNLGLHCQIINICTGDIGTVAAKKFDIEVWMPVQDAYREVVSCSNCTDYQARRLNMRASNGKDKYNSPHTQ